MRLEYVENLFKTYTDYLDKIISEDKELKTLFGNSIKREAMRSTELEFLGFFVRYLEEFKQFRVRIVDKEKGHLDSYFESFLEKEERLDEEERNYLVSKLIEYREYKFLYLGLVEFIGQTFGN